MVTMTSSEPIVHLRAVTKAVREGSTRREVLCGVDLDVAAGEAVAVLGRSGSGKSTLLNLVAGIDDADSGSIVTCGVDVVAAREPARARLRAPDVGFVVQAFHLLPTLTVAEKVALPLELAGLVRRDAAPRVAQLLQRVGLGDRGGAWPDVLSGGEQQRVAIARALVTRPRLVLCDEPTGNLDDAAAAVVLALLHELRRDHGCALLVATHGERAAASCDRRLRLDGGTLHAAVGAHA